MENVSEFFCTTRSLRMLNLLMSTITSIVIYKLSVQIHGGKQVRIIAKILCIADFFSAIFFGVDFLSTSIISHFFASSSIAKRTGIEKIF